MYLQTQYDQSNIDLESYSSNLYPKVDIPMSPSAPPTIEGYPVHSLTNNSDIINSPFPPSYSVGYDDQNQTNTNQYEDQNEHKDQYSNKDNLKLKKENNIDTTSSNKTRSFISKKTGKNIRKSISKLRKKLNI